jgi:hypothetical protein
MKEDLWLIVVVFLIWGALAIMYFTVPMIRMPHIGHVWGLGSLLFLGLAIVVAAALGKRSWPKLR